MSKKLALVVAFLLAAPSLALAQLTTGTISGTVKDSSAGVLPGVTVIVTHVSTGIARHLVTDNNGGYEAPNVPLGDYEIKAELTGFQSSVRRGITIAVGQHAIVDHVLSVGSLSEAITVVGESSLVETTSATVSNVVDARRVTELPLLNRDLTNLTLLQPGVVKVPRTGGAVFGGMGDTVSVGGARGTQNLYVLDGVTNADISGNPQSAMGSYVGAETVQEFQIITNNYSAEYRSQAGGIISAVTKSGTNSLHGSAVWAFRSDALDAANYFDDRFNVAKPDFTRHQYGGSLGGPLRRNQTFFFGSFEGLRERLGETDTITVPSMLARQGILPNITIPVADSVKPYMDLWPVPGEGNSFVRDNGDGTIQIAGVENRPTDGEYFLIKLDHSFNQGKGGRLAGTYNWDAAQRKFSGLRQHTGTASSGTGDGEGDQSSKNVLSIKHTSTWSPTIVNEFSLGYSQTLPEGQIPHSPLDFGSRVFLPQRDLMGQLSVGQVASLGFRTILDAYEQKILTFQNALSWKLGNHSLRLGGEFNPMWLTQRSCARGCNGIYEFDTLENFLRGRPERFDAVLPQGDTPDRHLRQYFAGGYFQDNWMVRSDLTLNMGLRYEYMTVPKERDGLTASLRDIQDTFTTIGPLYTNATGKSFSPRIGFAWAPGSRKTSLRGGFGIYYEHPNLYHARTTMQELPPFTLVGSVIQANLPAGTTLRFPDAYTTQINLLSAEVNLRGMQYEQVPSYGYRWSMMTQRELGRKWVGMVGYTGSRFLHLWIQSIAHLRKWEGYPNQPEGPKFFPAGAERVNPYWADMRIQSPKVNAFYHGLNASLQRRFSNGFDMQASYTLGKATDEGSGVTSGGDNLIQGQRTVHGYWDIHLDRGLAAHDTRNNFTANFTYELPFAQSSTGLTAALAKSWQLNGIVMIADGFPVSLGGAGTAASNRVGSADGMRVDLKPGGNDNPVLGGPDLYYDPTQFLPTQLGYFGTVGRNTLITPGMATFDLAVFKGFTFLGGGRKLQFRLETFNLFNRANFRSPNTTVFTNARLPNPSAGQITSTRTTARQMQIGFRFTF